MGDGVVIASEIEIEDEKYYVVKEERVIFPFLRI